MVTEGQAFHWNSTWKSQGNVKQKLNSSGISGDETVTLVPCSTHDAEAVLDVECLGCKLEPLFLTPPQGLLVSDRNTFDRVTCFNQFALFKFSFYKNLPKSFV